MRNYRVSDNFEILMEVAKRKSRHVGHKPICISWSNHQKCKLTGKGEDAMRKVADGIMQSIEGRA